MITDFQQYQVATLIYNLVFLSYFGVAFSTKDWFNGLLKFITLVIFAFGTASAIAMIRGGIHFNIITHTVCVYSAAMGTLFLFAPTTNWRSAVVKMGCITAIISTIIYFYL